MSDQPDYCSVKTIARRLDCSETTVADYTNRALLPQPHKLGTLVRWKWSEVEAMIDGLTAQDQDDEGTQDPILRAINGT